MNPFERPAFKRSLDDPRQRFPTEKRATPHFSIAALLVALNIGFLLGLAAAAAIISNLCWLVPK